MSSTTPTTPTTIVSAAPPLLVPPATRHRDLDEVSIASDFSVIPESLVETEGATGNCRTISTASFLHSEDLQPSLTAMESHSKVTFHGVQATYYCDSDIAVSYTLGSDVQPKSSDRVGLYRVGFTSPQDYLGYQWAPSPSADHTAHKLPLTVVFKADSLPKEVGEFFQFCYVTHEGQIVGVSAPFQLLRVGASREMCVVEEDGMVVVRSSESVLHDKINELSQQKDRLLVEVKELRAVKNEMGKQLEEKTQQLNMCQHHLQALEVKMKRETSEKCELMGRVGQVVEEKGHLEDKLRTVEAAWSVEKTRAQQFETSMKELEEAALASRKTLEQTSLSLKSLQEELATAKDGLKVTSEQLEEEKVAKEKAVKELEIWTSTAEADLSEKNSLALKFSTVNEELIAKLEELEATRRTCYSLEEKVKELDAAKIRLEGIEAQLEDVEKEKKVYLAREEVLKRDNAHLQTANTAFKERISLLEEEQTREQKGREAAETIASDLSGRLQAAKAEYHTLAITNRKLAKKVKKLRQRVVAENPTGTAMTASTLTSSWLHAEMEEDIEGDEAVGDDQSGGDEQTTILSQSCVSSLPSQHSAAPSCCSHSTQQLSEAMHKGMEDIVRELSQQILSLKLQLQEKEGNRVTQHEQQEVVDGEAPEDSTQQQEDEEEEEEDNTAENSVTQPETAPVLYSNSFLPTAPTAPVFLPEEGNATTATTTAAAQATPTTTQPSTAATDPTPAPRAHYYIPRSIPQLPTTAAGPGFLPPPLLPETTPTARHAAVLSQFTQQQLPTAPPVPGHESDDDDFHSTSDSDSPPATASSPAPVSVASVAVDSPSGAQETQQQAQAEHPPLRSTSATTPTMLPCPLCSLSFPSGTRRLLEEHVNSHLEHVCPVCSEVFQRNCLDKFQDHVQSHFTEEEEEEHQRQQEEEARRAARDTSGPWGMSARNAHLLEID